MIISANTKISTLLKANPDCIEAIVSINKHFEKLRNPILRKVLAPRVTIADAAKIGGCKVEDFYSKLEELGFETDQNSQSNPSINNDLPIPDFLKNINTANITTIDVREDIVSGNDPFLKIMEAVKQLPFGTIFLIINTFEPVPLIKILQKKGFEYYTKHQSEGLVHTYFKKNYTEEKQMLGDTIGSNIMVRMEFDEVKAKFFGKIREIDVRNMEMPLPMVSILEELENLPSGTALFVHHKKIPQYLFPELKERKFLWIIKELEIGNVKLLIYK